LDGKKILGVAKGGGENFSMSERCEKKNNNGGEERWGQEKKF